MQRIRWVDVHPNGAGVVLPQFHRELVLGMRNGFGVLSWLPHGHEVVRNALATHGRVLADGLVQQAQRLRPLHRRDRVFPDADLGVVDKPNILIRPDDLAPEVADADVPVAHLRCGQVHAVDRDKTPRHHHPVRLFDEELVVLPELVMRAAVAHIALAGGVGVERCERRREYRVVHRIVGQLLGQFNAVGKVDRPVLRLLYLALVDGLLAHRPTQVHPGQVLHVRHHLLGHVCCLLVLPLQVLKYVALG